ncbi:MAG: T9SS type A sorting domain-containing protein [Bacteroidetes bacterium]|nr:T9SS type A sorting domain-containing protein [Bacteroidota bacterium]
MKKTVLITIMLLFAGLFVNAQVVVTDPELPTADHPVTIYFDATKGTGGLKDYTGDVYAHTGVITQNSTSNTDWKYVKTNWGENTADTKLTKVSDNYYKLEITPNIREYYGVPASDTITHMAFVFRSDYPYSGTTYYEGKDDGSTDIIVEVFKFGLNVNITSPSQSSLVIDLNDTIVVNASATLADSISLFINSEFIKTSEDSTFLTDTIIADSYGENRVKVTAYDQPDFVADSFFYFVKSMPFVETLPDSLRDGINYTSDTTVTLVLYAPFKSHVFVIGDFTNWLPGEKGYMKITPDSAKYWKEIKGLTPGKEYRYQYLVDDELLIADPYADKVLDPWNDSYISDETYPNLTGYPTDTTSGIVSVLQTAGEEYQWHVTDFQPPDKTDLVIYELLIRDFTASHSYQSLTDTLNYLKKLGVNAVELMPVNEFEGNESWGYNPSFYFAPDKYYGPKNDLKTFIDSCHSNGIAVIIDMVLNHSYGQSPLVQLYFNPNAGSYGQPTAENPWYNEQSPNPVYSWGYDFDHESQATKDFVDRVNAYWLTEYNFDGFRFDFTKGFTNTLGDGGAYDASRISILKRMADHIWSVNPNAYAILEHFATNTEEKELAEYGTMIWGNMSHQYGEAAKGYSSSLSWGSYITRGWSVPHLVSYMESHDEERLMYKALTFGKSGDNYNIKEFATAIKRMELNALFFLTIPGPKMIWQFGELGYDYSIDYNGRVGNKPIKWDYYSVVERKRLYQVYSALNKIVKEEPLFETDDFDLDVSGMHKQINLYDDSMDACIIGNFDVSSGDIIASFSQTGRWYEFFTGDSIDVTDVNTQISLEAGEYKLYTTKKLTKPDITASISNPLQQDSYSFHIYPNPSEDYFTITMKGNQEEQSILSIIDIMGKVLCQPESSYKSGIYTWKWDGKMQNGEPASAGIYFCRIINRNKQIVKRLIRLK